MDNDKESNSESNKFPEEAETFEGSNNKLIAITGGILIGLSISALIAFLLIGYLAVPLVKEKAAWTQNSETRKEHLDEVLNEKKKNCDNVIQELENRIKIKKNDLQKYEAEQENISDKKKMYDALIEKISSAEEKEKKLSAQIVDKQASVNFIIERTKSEKNAFEKATDQLNEINNKISSETEKKKHITQENNELSERIAAGQTKLKDVETSAASARNEASQLYQMANNAIMLIKKAEDYRTQVVKSKNDLDELKLTIDAVKNELSEARKSLKSAKDELESASITLDKTKRNLLQTEQRSEVEKNNLSELKKQILEAEKNKKELDDINRTLPALKKEYDKLFQKYDKLREKN